MLSQKFAVQPARRPNHSRGRTTPHAFTNDQQQPYPSFSSVLGMYKSKAAMQVTVLKPCWDNTKKNNFYVGKEGALMFTFANSKGLGDREFAWDNSVKIALSSSELSQFLVTPIPQTISLFHDPEKGKASEGQIFKKLTFAHGTKPGTYTFNVDEKSNGAEKRVFVAITSNELQVLRSVIKFALPRLHGIDLAFQ